MGIKKGAHPAPLIWKAAVSRSIHEPQWQCDTLGIAKRFIIFTPFFLFESS
jgi:hypothetical protein